MMKLSTFAVIWAILYLIFGLGLLLMPNAFMGTYGVSLDVAGTMMTRILGAAITANAAFFWMSRHLTLPNMALDNFLVVSTIYNIVDIPIILMGTLNGTMNAMGWFPVILHIFLAVTQGYFAFRKG